MNENDLLELRTHKNAVLYLDLDSASQIISL